MELLHPDVPRPGWMISPGERRMEKSDAELSGGTYLYSKGFFLMFSYSPATGVKCWQRSFLRFITDQHFYYEHHNTYQETGDFFTNFAAIAVATKPGICSQTKDR